MQNSPFINTLVKSLTDKEKELTASFDIAWKYARKPPRHPLRAAVGRGWAAWNSRKPDLIKKNCRNWFYADLNFPRSKSGLNLEGTKAHIWIEGWAPFTLWIDGREAFKEEHPWKATGPIVDELPFLIEPGGRHRLIICVEPTAEPARLGNIRPLNVKIFARRCVHTGVMVGAMAAQLRLAEALAATDIEKGIVRQAGACIDLDSLKSNRWRKFRESVLKAEQALAPLSGKSGKITVHLIGHTHIDMDWLWTWEDTVHCIRRDFKAAAQMMDANSRVTFIHSQIPAYAVVKTMDPDVFRKVRKRIQEGRWENAASTWVEADLNMADGESIARHLFYAAQWSRKHFGAAAKVFWAPDTFGHPANMPQLAKLGECNCYFHTRCNPGGRQNWPARIWKGMDGTPIVAFSGRYGGGLYPQFVMGHVLDAVRLGLKDALHVWGFSDHGGGISRFLLEILALYRDKPLVPRFKFSTTAQLLAAVRKQKLPVNKGETDAVFEGCFTSRSLMKRYNRQCEGALLTAETLGAIFKCDKRKELKKAWTLALFNQFHDLLCGTSVTDAYTRAYKRAGLSLKLARGITAAILKRAAGSEKKGGRIVAINPLGCEASEPLEVQLPEKTRFLMDDRGGICPVQKIARGGLFLAENIPAFDARTFKIGARAPGAAGRGAVNVNETERSFRIETASAVAEIDKRSGAISSYYYKACRKEFVGFGLPKPMASANADRRDLALNVFQIIDEAPNPMSAWAINAVLKEENLVNNATVRLKDAGAVFARFTVAHQFRSSRITEEIFFYNSFPRIDFVIKIDWNETGDRKKGIPQLKLSFAAALNRPRARFEGPFAVMERSPDGQERPTQKWADLSGDNFGFALFNDSKYGCDALGGRLRMTLLRNAYCPSPDTDRGTHAVRLGFYPHGPDISSAELTRRAMAFNRPPLAVVSGKKRTAQLPGLAMHGADSVVCTAFKMAETANHYLVRFFETGGKKTTMVFTMGKGMAWAQEVNFLENPTPNKVKLVNGKAIARFHPFEVKTVLFEFIR